MNILVVSQHFYPEQFRINDLCYSLAKRGHKVTVLTGLPNYPKGKIFKGYRWFRNRTQIVNNVTIKRCSLVGRGNGIIRLGINYIWFAISASIKALFMKKDFDLIYVYQTSPITMAWPAIVMKKLAKRPLIIHCLDQWPISVATGPIKKDGILYKLLYKISKATYNKADLITISSKSFKKYFENELQIKDKGLMYYPSYAERAYEGIKHIENEIFDFVFAGNIGPAQSVETIIKAANLLKDNNKIKFHIVGDGLSKEACKKMAEELNLDNVIFYDFRPVEEVKEFYEIADAFIITMVDNEVVNATLPAKLQSYMLAKRPIVGAINGEVKEVIEEATCGLCCKSLDYEAFAKILLKMYNSKREQLEEWSNNSYKYYQTNYEKEKCLDDIEEIFKSVSKNYKKGRKKI